MESGSFASPESGCQNGDCLLYTSKVNPKVYSYGLVTIGEKTEIPANVQIGLNTAISGKTEEADYPDGILASGETLIKAGDRT